LDAGVALSDDGKKRVRNGYGIFEDYSTMAAPDVILTALTGQTFLLFKNLGKGQFQDVTSPSRVGRISSKLSGWGVVFADFDNDGRKDLFTANSHVTDQHRFVFWRRYKEPNLIMAGQKDGTFADVSEASGAPFAMRAAHRGDSRR